MKQITETEVSCLLTLLKEIVDGAEYNSVDYDSVHECIEILESLQNYEEPNEWTS